MLSQALAVYELKKNSIEHILINKNWNISKYQKTAFTQLNECNSKITITSMGS